MGLGTISKTYVALSLYNNLQLFHMQIKSHIGVYEYKDSKWFTIKLKIAHFHANVNT